MVCKYNLNTWKIIFTVYSYKINLIYIFEGRIFLRLFSSLTSFLYTFNWQTVSNNTDWQANQKEKHLSYSFKGTESGNSLVEWTDLRNGSELVSEEV